MKNMSNKQRTTTIAAMGAAVVFGVFSFGNSAEAARYSSSCQTLSGVLGPCCDRMMGSQLINVYGDCHSRKIVIKRKPQRPPVILISTIREAFDREGGGGNGGGNKDKGRGKLR
jgi:hypothetical protein